MFRRKTGFTLVELLISISLFTVIVVIVSSLFVTSFRLRQEVAIREQLYSDARFLMERLAREIRGSTLDYEEYFNRNVMAGAYGENYGRYVTQFYNPGVDSAYGSTCNRAATGACDLDTGAGCVVWTPGIRCTILRNTIDTHTGQNPYQGHPEDDSSLLANAFCGFTESPPFADPPPTLTATSEIAGACADPPTANLYARDELYLISPNGFEKTLFRLREDSDNPLLTMVKMRGEDRDNDGVADRFACTEDYACAPSSRGAASAPVDRDFVPISPNRLKISAITFYISPLESPFHGFSEPDIAHSHLPLVTIVLTVSPNTAVAGVHAGDFSLTLQETITTELRSPAPAPLLGQFDRPTLP